MEDAPTPPPDPAAKLDRHPGESDADLIARYARYGLWIAKHRGRREREDVELVYMEFPKPGDVSQMLTISYLPGWRSLTAQLGVVGSDGTSVEFWDGQDEPRASDFLDTRYRIAEVKGAGNVAGVLRAVKAAYDRIVALGPMGSVDPVTGRI